MNKRAMVIGILVILLFSAMAMGIHGAGLHKNVKEKNTSNFGQVVKIKSTQYTTHSVIRINSNADFTSTNGVVGGGGTQSDPYIISGWDIDAHGARAAVYIGNTTAYFVVENCILHNASLYGYSPYSDGDGISLYNITNGIVKNNIIHGNYPYGIMMQYYSNNIIVENNTIYDNYVINAVTNDYVGAGIFSQMCFDNVIKNNTIYNNGAAGIDIWESYRNTVLDNEIYENHWCGIYFYNDAHHNTVKNNTINNNTEGFYLNSSGESDIIEHNKFYDNKNYGIHLYSTSDTTTPANDNIIFDNIIYNSSYDIYLRSSNGNIISNNTIYNSSSYGLYIYEGSSNLIYANIFYYNHGSDDNFNPSHVQAYDQGTNNLWSSSSGIGNYWNGWANNNDTNDVHPHDGIVDWPYKIDGSANAKDLYPLKNKSLVYVLTPPQNLTAVSGYSYINLTWESPPSGSAILTGYKIYRDGSPIAVISSNKLWYNDTNVSVGKRYLYYVTSLSSTGESLKSNEVEIVAGGIKSGVIRINNNNEFAQMAQQEGWPGNGSKKNPYIISGYNINASGTGDAIYIGNTTAYFIVKNCYLHNASYHSDPYFDGSGIALYNATNGIIKYNTIIDNEMNGVHLHLAFNNTISGNNLSTNRNAIYLYSSRNNTLSENNISNSPWYGIVIWQSTGSIVEYNNITNISGGYALYFFLSSNNIINGNRMVGGGIVLYGLKNTFTTQNITANNMVNGKPVYYYKNANMDNATVPLNAGEVIAGNVSWLIIENLNLSNGSVGIELGYSNHITVRGNNIRNNGWDGIFLLYSNNSILSENTLSNNTGSDGIELQVSYNDTISGNNISGNEWYGVELLSCSGNTIIGNNITHNQNGGINLDTSSNNTIKDNNITYTGWDGIDIGSSSYNTITGNNISYNFEYYGISIDSKSHNNLIYYNSFYKEWIYAHDDGTNNSWNTTTGIGNYWYSWANRNNTNDQNHDGIVDWPYKIDGSAGAEDYYPLRCPIGRSAPSQPYNLTASSGDGYVNVTWEKPVCNGSVPIVEYKIYRNGTLIATVSASQLWYNDTNVVGGQKYTYYITAVNSVGESDKSNEVQATPLSVPLSPQNLVAHAGNGYVNLSWNAPRGNGTSPITSYRIYRNGVLIDAVPTSQLWYNNTNVVGGQNYTYYVTAVNSVGESEKSNEVQATPEQAVPELQAFWLPIIALLLLLGVLRRREKNSN